MNEIRDHLNSVFRPTDGSGAWGDTGGVLIWYGQRIAEEYYADPRHVALRLDAFVEHHYKKWIDKPAEQRPLYFIRYSLLDGFTFHENCRELTRASFENSRQSQAAEPSNEALQPPGAARQRAPQRTTSPGAPELPQARDRMNPVGAVGTLDRLLTNAETDRREGRRNNAIYIFDSFGFDALRTMQSMEAGGMVEVLNLRGRLNSFPQRLYQAGHLLIFLAPQHEQAQTLKNELFSGSPFVALIEAPEVDEDSIFFRMMAEELRGGRNAEVVACARQAAGWVQRRSSGRNRLLRKQMNELKGEVINQEFLSRNDVQDLDELFLKEGFLEETRKKLLSKMYKQQEAVNDVLEALADVAAQLRNAREFGIQRPPGPLFKRLLVGPSGTGKSHLPRVISQIVFGRPPYELRMQNITNRTSVLGAPAGHIGFGQVHSQLEELHKAGSGVVLIDEWERAGSDGSSRKAIHDTFMSVFEEGYLDTEDRRSISFHNCLIFVTSNLGMYEVDFGWAGLSESQIQAHMKKGVQRVDLKPDERKAAYERQIMIPNKDGVYIEPPWLGRLGGRPIVFDHFEADDMMHLATVKWLSKIVEFTRKQPPDLKIHHSLGPLYRSQFDILTGARQLNALVERQFNRLCRTPDDVLGLDAALVTIGLRDGEAVVMR